MSVSSFLSSHHAGELVFDKRDMHEIDERTSVEMALKVHSWLPLTARLLLVPLLDVKIAD
jgi:hypothetical protein